MRAWSRALVVTLALLGSGAAFAWPIDVAVSVPAGDVHFERPAAIAWAESADPSVATIEVMPSGEVLVTGVKKGETLALLYAEGKMGVWRIDVSAPGDARPTAPVPERSEVVEPLAAARKACPDLKQSDESDGALTVTVQDERCRKALLALFQTHAFTSHQVSLTFALEPLQAQLREISGAIAPIAPDVKASYVGAGLVLEGEVTQAQHRRILWEAFRHSIGRVPLEDQLHVQKPASADAGTDGGTP